MNLYFFLEGELIIIQTRYKGSEYAIAFLTRPDGVYEQKRLIFKELELLLKGSAFKNAFDAHVLEQRVTQTIPGKCRSYIGLEFNSHILLEFYFNSTDAFVGEMSPEWAAIGVGHAEWFIATRLLPCSPIDAPLHKFSGNDEPGDQGALTDDLTMAIHAFAHFTKAYSGGYLVFCDLQGRYPL